MVRARAKVQERINRTVIGECDSLADAVTNFFAGPALMFKSVKPWELQMVVACSHCQCRTTESVNTNAVTHMIKSIGVFEGGHKIHINGDNCRCQESNDQADNSNGSGA